MSTWLSTRKFANWLGHHNQRTARAKYGASPSTHPNRALKISCWALNPRPTTLRLIKRNRLRVLALNGFELRYAQMNSSNSRPGQAVGFGFRGCRNRNLRVTKE